MTYNFQHSVTGQKQMRAFPFPSSYDWGCPFRTMMINDDDCQHFLNSDQIWFLSFCNTGNCKNYYCQKFVRARLIECFSMLTRSGQSSHMDAVLRAYHVNIFTACGTVLQAVLRLFNCCNLVLSVHSHLCMKFISVLRTFIGLMIFKKWVAFLESLWFSFIPFVLWWSFICNLNSALVELFNEHYHMV